MVRAHSKETKRKLREAALRQFANGMPESTKQKLRNNCGHSQNEKTRKKISNYRSGKKMSEYQKQKLREATLKQMKEGRMPTKETSIERIMKNNLLFRGILYVKQYHYKLGVADFWLPETNTIIECDGLYWHNREKDKKRDIKQTMWLEKNNYIVFRFSDKDILSDINKCLDMMCKNGFI